MNSNKMTVDNLYDSKKKYYNLYKSIKEGIENRAYRYSQKLPTEIELTERYNVSRPTAAKASDLLRKSRCIERMSGVGTFVRYKEANIPVILMDRDIATFPLRSKYDLAGVDNFRLAYILTQHLLDQGCKRVKFIARPFSSPTVKMRILGYCQALKDVDIQPNSKDICIKNIESPNIVKRLLYKADKPGILCANGTTASKIMHALEEHGYSIPEDVKVTGVDDIKYANYLRMPLTTYKQPCKEFAEQAIEMMFSRIENPNRKARTVYLDEELIL